jgi:lipopolysaccharide transport system ATP-binding protein
MRTILLVDETLSVGDVGFQRKCLERMEKLIAQGRTVVFVSHDTGTLARLCSRVLLVNQGKVLADGPPADVIPLYTAKFNQIVSARSA